MSDGLGAGFAGLTIFAALLLLAGLLVVAMSIALYRRHRAPSGPLTYAAVGLAGGVLVVSVFAIVAFADEAPALAALFGVTAGLPVALVAGWARVRGASWLTTTAIAGMAWSLPFLVAISLLFALSIGTELSPKVLTGLAGLVTTGGALVCGEYVGSSLYPDETAESRA